MQCYPTATPGNTPILSYDESTNWYHAPSARRYLDLNGDGRTDVCVAKFSTARGAQNPDVSDQTCYLVVPSVGTPHAFTLKRLSAVIPPTFTFAPALSQDVRLLLSDWVATGESGSGGSARDYCQVWFRKVSNGNNIEDAGQLQITCIAVTFAPDGSIANVVTRPAFTWVQRFTGKYTAVFGPEGPDPQVFAYAFTDVNGDKVTDFCAIFTHTYGGSETEKKARQNVCFLGSSRGWQLNNLVLSEVYPDGLIIQQQNANQAMGGGGGRWVDFNGDGTSDFCHVTIGSVNDDLSNQFPVVKCEPTYRLPTGKVTFRATETVDVAKVFPWLARNEPVRIAETVYLLPSGVSIAYPQLSFTVNQQYVGKFRDQGGQPLRFSLHTGDFNGDKLTDFCVVAASPTTDYLNCLFSEPGKVALPASASNVFFDPAFYGTAFLLKGPLKGSIGNHGDQATTRTFTNFNGDQTADYCVADHTFGQCLGYFH